jgi:predicted ATP-grasp superfamily ATP-dependent carboligase
VPAVVLRADQHGALAAIRSLGRLGVRVHGVNDRASAAVLRSRYLERVVVDGIDVTRPAATAETLLEIGRGLAPQSLLLTVDDQSTLLVQEHAEALRERFVFPSPPAGLPRALHNKMELYALCERIGIATPRTFVPSSRDALETWLAEYDEYPVVVKPLEPRGAGASAARWVGRDRGWRLGGALRVRAARGRGAAAGAGPGFHRTAP